MNPHLEKRGAFAGSAAPRLLSPIPEKSPKWYWELSMVIRVCVPANTFSSVPKPPGTKSLMHCHSMKSGPREWRRNGAASDLAFGAFRFLAAALFFGSDGDTNSPAITNRLVPHR